MKLYETFLTKPYDQGNHLSTFCTLSFIETLEIFDDEIDVEIAGTVD